MSCSNGMPGLSGIDRVNRITDRASALRIPLNALIEITYKCNVDCIHCYCQHLNEPVKRQELTTDEWKRVLDELAQLGVLNLTMSGGEIFIRKDFWDIAYHGKKNHFALCFYTNGTMIDEEKADRLANLKPYKMEMSLLSPVEEMHDLLAQKKGSYQRVMRSCRLLKERNIPFILKTVLLKENVKHTKELWEKAKELGAVKEFQFGIGVTIKNDGSTSPFQHKASQEELFEYMTADGPKPFEVFPDQTPEDMKNKSSCGAANNTIAVTPYGDILPCIQLPIPMGNAREISVVDAWKKPPQVIDHIRKTEVYGDLPECGDCTISNVCHRCHGLAYLETGRWDAKYPTGCEEAKLTNMVNEYVKGGKKNHPFKKGALPILNNATRGCC